MKEIPLSQQGKNRGKYVALVDDDMYDELMKYEWCFSNGYAIRRSPETRQGIPMHRVIANTPLGMLTDHVSLNTLDNRRSNLRTCNKSQNAANRGLPVNNTSGIRGVFWHKGGKRWYAKIKVNGRGLYLGMFADKESAAHVYEEAAKKYFGKFARTA